MFLEITPIWLDWDNHIQYHQLSPSNTVRATSFGACWTSKPSTDKWYLFTQMPNSSGMPSRQVNLYFLYEKVYIIYVCLTTKRYRSINNLYTFIQGVPPFLLVYLSKPQRVSGTGHLRGQDLLGSSCLVLVQNAAQQLPNTKNRNTVQQNIFLT